MRNWLTDHFHSSWITGDFSVLPYLEVYVYPGTGSFDISFGFAFWHAGFVS